MAPNGHGGARPGAGRKPKTTTEERLTDALTAALHTAIGQSSVELTLDSKQQVKPTVSAYHPEVSKAGQLAEAEFDRLMAKYHPKAPASVPTSLDAFTDADLTLLGLKRA